MKNSLDIHTNYRGQYLGVTLTRNPAGYISRTAQIHTAKVLDHDMTDPGQDLDKLADDTLALMRAEIDERRARS